VKPEAEGPPTVGAAIAKVQQRKRTVDAERVTLRKRLALLDAEAEDLAKQHLTLLRKFDSVATLP